MQPNLQSYLTDVLGIESVFLKQQVDQKEDVIDILFLTKVSNSQEQELLDKMIKAMGLTQKFRVSEELVDAKVIVAFSSEKVHGSNVVTTHEIKNLLSNPDLKKETWAHLKGALKLLKK